MGFAPINGVEPWNLLGGYSRPETLECVWMVAGDGFEPPTFGL